MVKRRIPTIILLDKSNIFNPDRLGNNQKPVVLYRRYKSQGSARFANFQSLDLFSVPESLIKAFNPVGLLIQVGDITSGIIIRPEVKEELILVDYGVT